MYPPMRTRVTMTARSRRLTAPSLRRASADVLNQSPFQKTTVGRWTILVTPVLRVIYRLISELSAYLWIFLRPAPKGTPSYPMVTTKSG